MECVPVGKMLSCVISLKFVEFWMKHQLTIRQMGLLVGEISGNFTSDRLTC